MNSYRLGWVLLFSMAGNVLTLVLAVVLVNRAMDSGRKHSCDLVVSQQEVYRETPPVTAAGKKSAQAWNDIADRYGCTRGK